MSLSFISLGLGDKHDITVRGLQKVQNSDVVYLEYYTSMFLSTKEELEDFFQKDIILATRNIVEAEDNRIIKDAKEKKVAFLVIGDVFSATTHSDLYLRATQEHIQTDITYNASILTAVGCTGLQLYKFGKTTSLVFFEPDWKPQTAYDVIKENQKQNLHTLCLLDIKVAEPSKIDLAKENYQPQKPRFMTIQQAITQLQEIERERKENIFTQNTKIIGVARLGQETQKIVFGTVEELQTIHFGEPLHSLIIPAQNMHFHEEEMLELYKIKK
ncbi:MAG: diphthine synthase [Candidatus Woesearchaeota archaeon]